MSCPRSAEWLRYVTGELAPEARREMEAHREGCVECGRAYAALRETWDALGEWQVELPAVEMAQKVLARLDEGPARLIQGQETRSGWTVFLRVAASFLLAAGLGVGAGRIVPLRGASPETESAVVLGEVSEALTWLGSASDSATGLTAELEPEEVPEGAPEP